MNGTDLTPEQQLAATIHHAIQPALDRVRASMNGRRVELMLPALDREELEPIINDIREAAAATPTTDLTPLVQAVESLATAISGVIGEAMRGMREAMENQQAANDARIEKLLKAMIEQSQSRPRRNISGRIDDNGNFTLKEEQK